MAAGTAVGESQLRRIICDLHETVLELAKEYKNNGEPVTDDSTNLHKFSYKLEYLLQFDQKEKTTFLGTKKGYWDYFSDCLAKMKGANDGIRFVKCITELKTSLGKGRAFIRYSLVHQRLADTLQQCLMNQKVTSDWYYARSPFLQPQLSADIINHLYELNDVQFDVASRGHDLDASWPTFARRTLGSGHSLGHMWIPPSRSSSISSLASTYSQQTHEFSPDNGHSLLNDLNESLPACMEDVSTAEAVRLELDQSELKQRQLLDKMQQMGEEAAELRGVIVDLQRQLDVSLAAQEKTEGLQEELKTLEDLSREVEVLRTGEKARDAQNTLLQEKLSAAEAKNIELMAKLNGILDEKGKRAASNFDSAQKIHELLYELKEAEKRKTEAMAETEDKRKQVERLEEELRIREEAAKDSETKHVELVTNVSKEKAMLEAKVEQQYSTIEQLQGSLTLREKEASNLQSQLQDLQRFGGEKDRELEAMKEKEQDVINKTKRNVDSLKKSQEAEVAALLDKLKKKEAELSLSHDTQQQLESKNHSLSAEINRLTNSLADREGKINEQAIQIEDYKTQCTFLMESKDKLMTTMRRNEELQSEMIKNRTEQEAELAALRASEKQLKDQLDDSKVTVDEKEKYLREENCKMDESLQRATMAAERSEMMRKQLEEENQDLRSQVEEFEKAFGAARKNEASLKEQLRVTVAHFDSKEKENVQLLATLKIIKEKEKELEIAKANAEATCARQTEVIERVTGEKQAMEVSQLERSAVQAKENQEVNTKLRVVESQLEVSMKDVSRLQTEVLDLKVQVQRSEEDKLKLQAQLEVTEAQRDELRSLTEQLKIQAEDQNQKHIMVLMECKKKEEMLTQQRDREEQAHAELATSSAVIREELSVVKAENTRLALEHSETREALHRANTEMAELGITICKLNSEQQEAREHWAEYTEKIEELDKEVERLGRLREELLHENGRLQEELTQRETLPGIITELQNQLEKTKNQMQSVSDGCQEEMEAVKFQMSSETMNYQITIKSINEQLDKIKAQLKDEQSTVSNLQAKVSELEAENETYFQLIGEKDAHITKTEEQISENDCEIQQLKNAAASAEEAHLALQKACEELRLKLKATEADRESQCLKMTAEIDDLNRTKTNLEERLIELLKDKDALWQKSDALEFEQKLRAEERWWLVDKEATHCLSCQGQFTWWLRRHHCRLCGRIFCYYCSNNFVTTKHNGVKERCCQNCYTQHSTGAEKFTEEALSPSHPSLPLPPGVGLQPEAAPQEPTPRVTVSDPSHTSDEGAFDIITEEEVNGVYDSDTIDTISQTSAGSLEGEQDCQHSGALEKDAADITPEEEHGPTLQDSEIILLKSGEVTMAVPLTTEDLSQFGDGSLELFIKSSCYSVVTVAVGDFGTTLKWTFSSEPKSIYFSVVFLESSDAQVEQSKVLIPLTRCSSHKERIQGQLKVRHPGLYTLIFDNSFSRFISKKVFYHLTVEKPVIYDGSDCP
ncbi:unnamed protein product [Menidia menidia]|uniref:FYVE and coiled-coil domain-containing protein 1 n=1 Tax=Menidia menidia TaxID=238744 RepID=A0A8S4ACP2_9TELE|nr:unnamed protein product [Menidia menidia]